MKKILVAILLCSIAMVQHAFAQTGPSNSDASPHAAYKTQNDFTYELIPSANNTWGYDISVSGKVLIHQLTIPGIGGHEGFKTKEKAERVAKLAIEKIRNGIIPPAVSKEEMKAMNVL